MKVSISPERLGRHVAALTAHGPRFADLPGVPAALRYIADELSGLGYTVRAERYGDELHEVNLLAELSGSGNDNDSGNDAKDPLELGAHWDSVAESPGADDNASGVAGVLEAARALRRLSQPLRTIRFCFFGGEEDGFGGSTAHVERISAGTGSIILEMIGYATAAPGSQRIPEPLRGLLEVSDRGDFIALIANQESAEYLDAVGSAAGPDLEVFPLVAPTELLPTVARSDHVPYWVSGRRSLMVTDTAEYRNPHYHQASDTLDRLDLDFAARVTAAVTAGVAKLAG